MKHDLKVMTVVGTRPEIIRLSRVISELDSIVDHCLVHTGQNYDYELNSIFFDDLGLRKPDIFLESDTSSLGAMLGSIISSIEKVFLQEAPDALLILGDTNSSIVSIVAKRMKIPIYHMEAGNRCFDENVPEEVNRRIVDRISDFNLVYTEHARRHLLSEGFPHRRIYLTGSPMNEVLGFYSSKIEKSDVLDRLGLCEKGYFIASIHREENVDNEKNLKSVLESLQELHCSYSLPVIVSTHPRTRKRLEEFNYGESLAGIEFMKPFGFFDYNKLQKNAKCVISDSGTITEESSILGFPAVTIRNSMERPEGLDTGSIILTGLSPESVVRSVNKVVFDWERGRVPDTPSDYLVNNVSQRVVNIILGTSVLSNKWHGIDA